MNRSAGRPTTRHLVPVHRCTASPNAHTEDGPDAATAWANWGRIGTIVHCAATASVDDATSDVAATDTAATRPTTHPRPHWVRLTTLPSRRKPRSESLARVGLRGRRRPQAAEKGHANGTNPRPTCPPSLTAKGMTSQPRLLGTCRCQAHRRSCRCQSRRRARRCPTRRRWCRLQGWFGSCHRRPDHGQDRCRVLR